MKALCIIPNKETMFCIALLIKLSHKAAEHAANMSIEADFDSLQCTMIVLGPLHKLWNLPPKNRYFIGRDDLLDEVASLFGLSASLKAQEQLNPPKAQQTQSNGTVTVACHGLGGVGKTQLAVQFAYKHHKTYQKVFWFPAETPTEIEAAYQQMVQELMIDVQGPQNIVREIKLWFEQNPGCLLIYDNAPDYETIKSYLPSSSTDCHIIVTSRTTNWHWFGESLTIDVFTEEEARLFFKKLLGNQYDMSNVDILSATLGYLPLALAQAGAYLKKIKILIPRYLELYEKEKQKLLTDVTLPSSHHGPAMVTWDIPLEAIQKESLLATQMLKVCAYVHHDDIPEFLLLALNDGPETEFQHAKGVLIRYSMIKVIPEKDTVSIQRQLQEVIQLKEQNDPTSLLQALKIMLKVFPQGGYVLEDSEENYQKKSILVPHMESILNHLDKGLSEEKRDIIDLFTFLTQLAGGYHVLGDDKKACEMLKRSLRLQEQHYGHDHPEVANTLTYFGTALESLGNYTKMRILLFQSLKIKELHYGLYHPTLTITLNSLSNTYGSVGNYTKQCDLLERSLQILEQHSGPNHLEVAITLSNLGNAYGNLGNYTKQSELLEQSLKILQQHHGPDHPTVTTTLTNLATAYGNLGDYTKQHELLGKDALDQDLQNTSLTLDPLGKLTR